MDFSWTEEQIALKKEVINFAQAQLNKDILQRDKQSSFSKEAWQKCAEFGILGLPFSKEYGGNDADILTTVYVMEGLGYGCKDNGLIFGINAQMWSVQMPIFEFGTDDQKKRYLPKLIEGNLIGAHCMSEPGSGSDAFGLKSTATRKSDRYILNGSKTFVTNGPVADVFIVFATIDKSLGFMGITAFVVDRKFPGIIIGKNMEKLGLKTSTISEIYFEDCEVPIENRLSLEGNGSTIFNSSMECERSAILATNIGAMERQLGKCIEYANNRHQFGKPISKFQSVSNRIVNMKIRLETARLLLYKTAWLKDTKLKCSMDSAIAKLYISESWVQSSLDAIQIHGGYGYMSEFEVEKDLRDSIGGTLYSGTSDIQRNIIAGNLKL